jgi:hypothetical protein
MTVEVKPLVYIDSGVLIAAARGVPDVSATALAVLAAPDYRFASSAFVRLEVLPKALNHLRKDEAAFYETFFDNVSVWASITDELLATALAAAELSGLSAMDALHIAAAAATGAEELVTSEQSTKPIHRSSLVRVRTISTTG